MPVGSFGTTLYGAGVGPVDADVADVGERVAQRAQLPVEHGVDPAPGDIGEHVAEPIVAVSDRHALLIGEPLGQAPCHLLDRRQFPRLRALPLGAPAFHLPLDVPLTLRQIAEADGVDVDVVEVGEHVDQIETCRPTVVDREQSSLVGAVEHHAVDEPHHVERRAVHLVVGAESECRRDGNVGLPDGRR